MMNQCFTLASRLPVILMVLLLAGCGGADFNRNSNTEKFTAYEGEVEVLKRFPPDDEYASLGVVSAEGGIIATESSLIKALKKTAAENGADAIVLQSQMLTVPGMEGTTHKMAAFAIRRRH